MYINVHFSNQITSIIIQLWKNPLTGELHFQVHPSAVYELLIEPIPDVKRKDTGGDALYPDGAHITDLNKVRDLVYQLQRPSISPEVMIA
jgi:xanthine dioxygenase